jgi:plastocyanin
MRPVRTAAAMAGVVCALLPSVDASTNGTVAGRVTLTAVRSAPSPSSAYGRRGVAPRPAAVGPETRKVIVHLAPGQGLRTAAAPRHATIVQRGEQFVPPLTVITTGSTVKFPNEDPFFHNVFSLSRVATFDLGRYPAGASRAHVFDKPGIVKVFCHIHAQMNAVIAILDHPYFSVPEDDGRYTLPPVPAGDYTLVAWHERIGEQRRPVRVEAGATARVDFTLPVLEGEQ